MTKDDLRQIIKEAVQSALDERRDFDYLSHDIPGRTIIGGNWNEIVRRLENLMNEVEGFNETFITTMKSMGMKERLATQSYVQQLQQVVKILEQLRPAIKVMTEVETQDELSENHIHGRYAQQAGATPFRPPGD